MNRKSATLLVAGILALVLSAGMVSGDVWVDGDSVRVSQSVYLTDYGTCSSTDMREAWNPSDSTLCDIPDLEWVSLAKSVGFIHFKIIDPTSNCLYVNGRLQATAAGTNQVTFAIPIGEVIDESKFVFSASSDPDSMVLDGYGNDTTFSIQFGSTYKFLLTEQTNGCGEGDGEGSRMTTILTVSCCDLRGDANDDGYVDVTDIGYLVAYVWNGGPPPPCMEEGDVNDDGYVDGLDISYMVAYAFQGGPAPVPCP